MDVFADKTTTVSRGEDALIATADVLYQAIGADTRFSTFMADNVDLPSLAQQLRIFLSAAFEGDGGDWPSMKVGFPTIEGGFDSLAEALLEALNKPAVSQQGDDAIVAAMDHVNTEMKGDPRIQSFYETMKASVISWDEGLEEEEEGAEEAGEEEGEEDAAQEEEDGEKEEEEGEQGDTSLLKDSSKSTEINVNSFEELVLEGSKIQAAQDAWRLFISTAASREAAGEAIYNALFEGAPSLQVLFTTPRAVQAMRFMGGLNNFVFALDEPPKLKTLVETLGFGHLHLDVTIPRVIIFRDAILDLFAVELAERFTSSAREGWKDLLNYVGGAIIFVKAHYAERINILLRSWKIASDGEDNSQKLRDKDASSASGDVAARAALAATAANKQEQTTKKKRNWFGGSNDKKDTNQGTMGTGKEGGEEGGGEKKDAQSMMAAGQVPTTFPEMFMFNAAVMGFGQNVWMSEVLDVFHDIVTNVANSARLQQECDVLALRISIKAKGKINLGEFKAAMLAALRSLLPKDWSNAHDVAWTWLWENVERLVMNTLGKPQTWERALTKLIESIDETRKYELRKDIYARFFAAAPAGQDFFKQSNTYLHIIADRVIDMTINFYRDPVKMVDDISALGLRHVGYAIPTELFAPFVTACVEVVQGATTDEVAIESFRWSLGLVAKMLVRTINEGSTIVMKAINANSMKTLKKAISCAPRGERAEWMLKIQVGTQTISPLLWSIESGNLESAKAIIMDLLTFRADRDKYYYGVDDLFSRHPDIVLTMCNQAPVLLPVLFTGLIWRSRQTENGQRRVNYYIKHLTMDADENFSKTLNWIQEKNRDPKLVCHPVLVVLSDLVWSGIAWFSFLYGKLWFVFTLLLFVASQSVLNQMNSGNKTEVQINVVFGARCFFYGFSMTQLMYAHAKQMCKAYRNKDTVKIGCVPIPTYLTEWQEVANLCLTGTLVLMLALEPILHCWPHNNGILFYEECEEAKDIHNAYGIASMVASFLYFLLLIDLAVFSTRVSAFVLVCVRMTTEVGLFILALIFTLITFASCISALQHDLEDFNGIHHGMMSLWELSMGVYLPEKYDTIHSEPAVLFAVFTFMIASVIFLLNMLIAQLTCAYGAIYEDMVGFARLNRIKIVVESMQGISKRRWSRFLSSCAFEKCIEFNDGDIGVAGGMQMKEPSSANPTTVDAIKRFGGSTSPSMQWPEEEGGDDDSDRFDRIEKLIQKALKRLTGSGSSRHGSGGGSGSKHSSGKMSGDGDEEGSAHEDEGGSGGSNADGDEDKD